MYDLLNVCHREPRKGKIVSGMEYQDIAAAMNRLASEERMGWCWSCWCWGREDCRKVVVECKGGIVVWILFASNTSISRTEMAFGIVVWQFCLVILLDLAEPWSISSMGRDENMFASERIY